MLLKTGFMYGIVKTSSLCCSKFYLLKNMSFTLIEK